MTHQKTDLFHRRPSGKEFLLYKTDAMPDKGTVQAISSPGSEKIRKVFPDLLAGKDFIENAAVRLKSSEKFDAIVIKIDKITDIGDETEDDGKIERWLDVAKIIDVLCRHEDGIWGRLDQGMLGCFFTVKNQTTPLKLAQKIKTSLAESTQGTVSMGMASYPTLSFKKEEILDNAVKALDHAAFFGPASIVAFDAVSLNISGDNQYQHGDIDGAVKEYKTAILLDPSDVNIRNSLGVCYGILGDYAKALKEFKQALKLNPDEVMVLYNIGLVNMLTGKPQKALEYFLEADRKKEDDIFEVAFQIGKVYLTLKNPKAAKEYLEKAVALNAESGPALRALGECCSALNMTDEAIFAYKKAIRQNPNDAQSLSALGYLFDLLGENHEITTIFCQQSVDISPETGLFRHRLGSLYLKRNQLEDALAQFEKAHKLGYNSKDSIKKIKKLMKDAG
jgi:tetratricopeptide (TPR) repeat protein